MTWQVKDFADGWIDVANEAAARKLSVEQSGAAIRNTESAHQLLVECAVKFREYEALHRAKGTEDAESKAVRNGEIASRIEEHLRSTP